MLEKGQRRRYRDHLADGDLDPEAQRAVLSALIDDLYEQIAFVRADVNLCMAALNAEKKEPECGD